MLSPGFGKMCSNIERCVFNALSMGAFFIFGESMEYTIEQLLLINIHSLRIIARDMGVRAPTALTKPVLIDEIIKVQSGEKEPYVPNKRGRPAGKCVGGVQFVVNPEEKKDLLKIKEQVKKELIADIITEIKKQLEKVL